MDSNDSAIDIAGQVPARTGGAPGRVENYKLVLACSVLLAVTWLPLLGIHVYKTSLSAQSTGMVVVVFPPTSGLGELFRDVVEANGSLVRPINWFPRAWIVHALEPGFAGRLRERGAWGVFSPDLLNPDAILNCVRISTARAPDSAREPLVK